MWYRAFIASNIVFFFGIFLFLMGEHLLPELAAFTFPTGALLSGTAGLVGAISGIALILAPNEHA